MASDPREHIEEIRRTKYSIGGPVNHRLHKDLHQAAKNLSAELYSKDVHFLMEIIQNAEDNDYPEEVKPSLEFVITSKDITATGAPATLLIFNNEKGFTDENIESICSIGSSTKEGKRNKGYIGQKGIGFKSVFLITSQPYIFSNGYQIRFDEAPCRHCGIGYIVPEWIDSNPSRSEINQIYGSGLDLPTTTIVLPLKPDKVEPVKQQLSSIHPEVLLFLSKIKRLSVRENNEDPRLNTVNAISILSETDISQRKNIDAVSYTLHLSAGEGCETTFGECPYYMWKQRFPVKQESKVDMRRDVDEWVITLAFPFVDRINRGKSSPGVYAFLPTEMVTNFPFIIQADFLLPSSRETILLDNKWNQGILGCVPTAFLNAFVSLEHLTVDAPVSSLAPYFKFLPVQSSPEPRLNIVRDSIKELLMEENIIPIESSCLDQKYFHKPSKVRRIMPEFWEILAKARGQGMNLYNLSSPGCHILNSSFDLEEYDDVLDFLGVKAVDNDWYGSCIQRSNLVLGVTEDVYLELLLFISDNWSSKLSCTSIRNVPLLKYVALDQLVHLCSINDCISGKEVCLSFISNRSSWLIDWNKEFRCVASCFLMPKHTQDAFLGFEKKEVLWKWMKEKVMVSIIDVNKFALRVGKSLNSERNLLVAYVHFLYLSHSRGYLSIEDVENLCSVMPLVDDYGEVTGSGNGVLFPAKVSDWSRITGSDLWRREGYVVLSEDYLQPGNFAGVFTPENELKSFLSRYVKASDIPQLLPPNTAVPAFSSPLNKINAFLLLDWIRYMIRQEIQIPNYFLKSVREGKWLRITAGGSPDIRSPSQSFLLSAEWESFWHSKTVLVDIPVIDQNFYGEQINKYEEELKVIGVKFEYEEACEYVGKHLISLPSSSLTKSKVLSVLDFIRFLREKDLRTDKFINTVNCGKWISTSVGFKSPAESVLFDQDWVVASQISDIPFIDQSIYGVEIHSYKEELMLLGLQVAFGGNYLLVVSHLKPASSLTSVTADAFLLMLQCIRHVEPQDKVIEVLKATKCLMTNSGYKSPVGCFLSNPEWDCLLQVFNSFSVVKQDFYGSRIVSYKDELKKVGVLVEFEDAAKVFDQTFRQHVSSISKENTMSLLACYRQLNGTYYRFPSDECIQEECWLRTRLGFRSPRNSILFSSEWKFISTIAMLPFIDDSEKCYGQSIYKYKAELERLGVVTSFSDGVHGADILAKGLRFPKDPICISPESSLSLLECVQVLLKRNDGLLPEELKEKLSQPWLKTNAGYRSPFMCLLYDSNWIHYLQPTDGAFIDENFYGSAIVSYRYVLSAIGVTVEVEKGCALLAGHLHSHSEFSTILRIYKYLCHFNWQPGNEARTRIWICEGEGEWANSGECVLHDQDGLFDSQLHVLDKYYERKLLTFFAGALEVRSKPSVIDYCKIWKSWENSGSPLSPAKCLAFWSYIAENWNKTTESTLIDSVVKLPVISSSREVILFEKYDVFIADDIILRDVFEQASSRPLFVWFPEASSHSLLRSVLLDIYKQIGVPVISESIQKENKLYLGESDLKKVNSSADLIGKELVRIILGFLATPSLNITAEMRHKAVTDLLRVKIFETDEFLSVGHSLQFSSGEILDVKINQMVYWNRADEQIVRQKIDWHGDQRARIEFATCFSEVISKGILWEKEDHTGAPSELIKLAFLLDFNDRAVEFLMRSKNLQTYMEDDEFLSRAFSYE